MRHRKALRSLLFSCIVLAALFFLVTSVDYEAAFRALRNGLSPRSLMPFAATAVAIAAMYAWRWQLLLDRRLTFRASLIASSLSLGGNMFLPARGGDLLRVHYSHSMGDMPHSEVLSRLFVEKVVDLVTIAVVGALASLLLQQGTVVHSSILMVLTFSALAMALGAVVMIKFFGEAMLRLCHPLFRMVGKSALFERHVAHLVRDASRNLTLSHTLLPSMITLVMWLSVYAFSYGFAAQAVGVALTYTESLVVVFGGALGLMLPAAPSGVGTFHASVVSAFIFLGRSPAEGLLAATVIHLLFFVLYVVPAAFLYGRWRLTRKAPN